MMKIWDFVTSLLFPHKCIICEDIIDFDGYCDKCKDLMKEINAPTCFNCGVEHKYCTCSKFIYHFDGSTAPYYNEGVAQQAVYDFKFSRLLRSVNVFSEVMANRAAKVFGTENIDLVTCVPAGKNTMRKRGFNQSELYAENVARRLGLPFDNKLLSRKDSVTTQHLLKGLANRFENVRNGYICNSSLKGKNILLVDDIRTTGASLDECARQLKICGAEKVYCLTALVSKFTKTSK